MGDAARGWWADQFLEVMGPKVRKGFQDHFLGTYELVEVSLGLTESKWDVWPY